MFEIHSHNLLKPIYLCLPFVVLAQCLRNIRVLLFFYPIPRLSLSTNRSSLAQLKFLTGSCLPPSLLVNEFQNVNRRKPTMIVYTCCKFRHKRIQHVGSLAFTCTTFLTDILAQICYKHCDFLLFQQFSTVEKTSQ